MKRWTIRISPRRAASCGLICLLLGAILNVAMAWGAIWVWPYTPGWSMNPELSRVSRSQRLLYVGIDRDRLRSIIVWTTTHGMVVFAGEHNLIFEDPSGDPAQVCPPWLRDVIIGNNEDGEWHVRGMEKWWIHARGWPRLSLWGRLEKEWLTMADIQLPLRPIFPGFIINTLFYALICFALLFAPGMIRRRIRSARGRCIKCGYDLRGSDESTSGGGCPECGWGREDDAAVR